MTDGPTIKRRNRDPRATLKTSLRRFSKNEDEMVADIASKALRMLIQAELDELEEIGSDC